MATNVYIIEDHPLTGLAMQQFLQKSDEWNITKLVTTGREALTDPIDTLADLILLDLSLPDMSGIQLLQELQVRYPTIPCLVFSSYQDAAHICRALCSGAKGYTVKDEPSSLIPAMRHVLAGQVYLSERAHKELAATYR